MPDLELPSFNVPPGACDSHAHIIGPPPYAPTCSYEAAEAPLRQYLQMLDRLGIERGVLVQPEAHGTDNRLLVRALRDNSERLRGVAVVSPDSGAAELKALASAGVCGVRVGTTVGLAAVEALVLQAAPHGLHLEIMARTRDMPLLQPRLERLGIPIVIDHMACPDPERGVADAGFQILLELAGRGICWVKLSAAYHASTAGRPYRDTAAFARTLIDAAPNGIVWGSDWPHLAVPGKLPDAGALLNLLLEWAPDEAVRRRILVENPARLYGY
jgi:2-pyrone-4,6-dicarboxylate lactonase